MMRCKSVGCLEEVNYEPQPVYGLFGGTYIPPQGRRTIYLTCPQGHTHPYIVWLKAKVNAS